MPAGPRVAAEFEQVHPDTETDSVAVEPTSGHGSEWRAPPATKTEPPARPIGTSDVEATATVGRFQVGSDLVPTMVPIAGVRREPVPPARPTVQVTIGRIEVRAVQPPPAPPVPRAPVGPRISLDEYLRERNEGRP